MCVFSTLMSWSNENKSGMPKVDKVWFVRAFTLHFINFITLFYREIGFRKGDIVLFYRSIDANWCEGEAQGQIGLYPTSYVEVCDTDCLHSIALSALDFYF